MKYGLIGEKLTHSFSKEIHKRLQNEEYELFPLSKEEFPDFMKKRDFLGINVTIPYKKDVMEYCDEIDERAKEIGSVNTVINNNGKLTGFNTDYDGLCYLCKKSKLDFKNKKVSILGTGGTSNTAFKVLTDLSAEPYKIDRFESVPKNTEIIINTTPVGMFPNIDESRTDISNLSKLTAVFDVVYNPLMTRLTFDAKQRGLYATNGLLMLIVQACASHELFFNTKVDIDTINSIYKDTIMKRSNLVLIGMSGSGKSIIGKELSKKLDMNFLDLDAMIESRTDMTVAEIFDKFGEEKFRKIESDLCFDVSMKNGFVISTGGGTIINEDNYRNLKLNSVMILIERDLKKIELSNRPLTPDFDAMEALYKERKPIYEACCDIKIKNDSSSDECAERIIKEVNKYYETACN